MEDLLNKIQILQEENSRLKEELGYEYEIWVYDCKGNKVETHI
jgi:cell shape-determining protein MreC